MKNEPEITGGIGASEVPALFGLSPHRSALSVYMDKIGTPKDEPKPEDARLRMELASVSEETIIASLGRRMGRTLKSRFFIETLGDLPDSRLTGRPAALDMAGGCVIDLRFIDAFSFRRGGWGPEGGDEVPEWMLLRAHAYMIVSGMPRCISVAVVDRSIKIYNIKENAAIRGAIRSRVNWFWDAHVAPRIPPEPQNAKDAAALNPFRKGNQRQATARELLLYSEYSALHRQIAGMTAKKDALKAELVDSMADHDRIVDIYGAALVRRARFEKLAVPTEVLRLRHPELCAIYNKEIVTATVVVPEIESEE